MIRSPQLRPLLYRYIKYKSCVRPRTEYGPAKLTPQEVSALVSQHEAVHEVNQDSILRFESNQLGSNTPIEDRRAEAKCLLTSGTMFAVFDGHGGWAAAQALSERLFNYVAVGLLPAELLAYFDSTRKKGKMPELIEKFVHQNDIQHDQVQDLHLDSLGKFASESLSVADMCDEFIMKDALQESFVRLDADFSREAKPTVGNIDIEALRVAFSGAVAVLAHVDGPHLHVANVGDCRAVLGSMNEETQTWHAMPLSIEHDCGNNNEVQRIRNMHPHTESSFVLKNDRLLGQLAPLRAFGDMRYKWTLKELHEVVNLKLPQFDYDIIPPNYFTPPYLIARPQVKYHRLTPRDKFLILASDGLWDFLEPDRVVQLVGEYMAGRQTVDVFRLPSRTLSLGDVNSLLSKRAQGLAKKPVDQNCATHLIRNALGGTYDGIDHSRLSALLSLPKDIVRFYRDDITVTVVYFDSDYLRTCPV